MKNQRINDLVNAFCVLRDRQYAVYDKCAAHHGLTVNELFVLDILWFSPAAITGRFLKKGYISLHEVKEDRRNKRIIFTDKGKAYAQDIIPYAAHAENLAMEQMGETNAAELVRLATEFTENMEICFSEAIRKN